MNKSILSRLIVAWSLVVAAAHADPMEFNIEAQPLASALATYAEQADLQVLFPQDSVRGLQSKTVRGSMEKDRALQLLLEETGLEASFAPNGTVLVKVVGESKAEVIGGAGAPSELRLAQTETKIEPSEREKQATLDKERDENEEQLAEIVVTGTHIRGATPSASPLLQVDREDIVRSGVATVAEYLQRAIPQNFASGASERTFLASRDGSNFNQTGGSGVNLRGLGNDSTLILLNGRRIAPSSDGTFVDVSMIPLAAIDHVDILMDGASALYGSDAVGGVVNFILRRDYQGAETRLRYGTVTEGSLAERQVGQTFGRAWSSGNALVSYEYYDRDNLDANDRDFTRAAADPRDLLPSQRRHSFMLSGNQDLSAKVHLFGTALWSDRDSVRNAFDEFNLFPGRQRGDTQQQSGTLGARMEITPAWQGELAGTYSHSDTRNDIINADDGSLNSASASDFDAWSFDGRVDGALFAIPGGETKLAVGGQYRSERLDGTSTHDQSRNVAAAFAEVLVPLVGESNSRAGLRRLELSLAARGERYSDFGNTFDPKVGAVWTPIEGLNIRGTWGTSFRAPLLRELDDSTFLGAILNDFPNPASADGSTLGLVLIGNNPDLDAEEATTWTLGADLHPAALPGLRAGLTYFNIDFSRRITEPDLFNVFFGVFADPAYDLYIAPNADPAFALDFITRSEVVGSYLDFTGGAADPVDTEVLIDARTQNFAETRIHGLDFNLQYLVATPAGDWSPSLTGTYLIKYTERVDAQSPAIDIRNNVFRPVDLRLRGGLEWRLRGLTASAYVNYLDNYRDERFSPAFKIASWTTIDLSLQMDLGAWSLADTSLSLTATNLLDKAPPFVTAPDAPLTGLNFDPENHDPLGRLIALGLSHRW